MRKFQHRLLYLCIYFLIYLCNYLKSMVKEYIFLLLFFLENMEKDKFIWTSDILRRDTTRSYYNHFSLSVFLIINLVYYLLQFLARYCNKYIMIYNHYVFIILLKKTFLNLYFFQIWLLKKASHKNFTNIFSPIIYFRILFSDIIHYKYSGGSTKSPLIIFNFISAFLESFICYCLSP